LRGLFVTGTDTGAGKTVLSGCLLAAMRAAGESVAASKPVLTGLDELPAGEWPADDELLASVTGQQREQIAPFRFGPAVSPHLAAELAGEPIDTATLAGVVRAAAEGASATVVEGVGGLLVPLGGGYLVRDLAVELGLPLVIAARAGLGTISHTLLTLDAARRAGLDVRAVVLTPWPARPGSVERSNRETIAHLGSLEVAVLGELTRTDPATLAAAAAELPWRAWLGSGAESLPT
jgi:dethiobiotin synthetase